MTPPSSTRCFGDETEKAGTAAALESVKGLLRTEVGRQTGIRYTPTLTFIADAVPENAAHIDDLLRKARESDAAVADTAVAADFAGEADPYRAPRAPEDDDEFAGLDDEPDGSTR